MHILVHLDGSPASERTLHTAPILPRDMGRFSGECFWRRTIHLTLMIQAPCRISSLKKPVP